MVRSGSIRKRLLITLIGLIGVTWLGMFVLVSRDATHELEELYDASLAQNARILFGLLQREVKEGEVQLIRNIEFNPDFQHAYELNIAFWASLGKTIIKSRDAPDFLTQLPDGFSNYTFDGKKWRVFTLRDNETGLVIHAAQKLLAREELVSDLTRDTLSVMMLVLPLLGLLVWWGVSRSLKPLKQMVDEAGAMSPRSLRPFNIDDAPDEVSPLIIALNQLLERLNQAIDNERRFTSDAAHELRTPLAGLKVQLQVALRAEEPQQRTRAMHRALEGIDRITHLVNQLLTLARADREAAGTLVFTAVDLVALAREVMQSMTAEAQAHGATLSIHASAPTCMLSCEPVMIQIAIRNLLENAIRYAPLPARVEIGISAVDDGILLSVRDSGAGIPREALELMFQRFRRGEHNGHSGSGLGLSIVQRICEIHGAELEVEYASPAPGFSIAMHFRQGAGATAG